MPAKLMRGSDRTLMMRISLAEEMQSLPKSRSPNHAGSRRRTPGYGRQAERFDERAGLGDSAAAAIARAVSDMARMSEGAVLRAEGVMY